MPKSSNTLEERMDMICEQGKGSVVVKLPGGEEQAFQIEVEIPLQEPETSIKFQGYDIPKQEVFDISEIVKDNGSDAMLALIKNGLALINGDRILTPNLEKAMECLGYDGKKKNTGGKKNKPREKETIDVSFGDNIYCVPVTEEELGVTRIVKDLGQKFTDAALEAGVISRRGRGFYSQDIEGMLDVYNSLNQKNKTKKSRTARSIKENTESVTIGEFECPWHKSGRGYSIKELVDALGPEFKHKLVNDGIARGWARGTYTKEPEKVKAAYLMWTGEKKENKSGNKIKNKSIAPETLVYHLAMAISNEDGDELTSAIENAALNGSSKKKIKDTAEQAWLVYKDQKSNKFTLEDASEFLKTSIGKGADQAIWVAERLSDKMNVGLAQAICQITKAYNSCMDSDAWKPPKAL